MAKLDDFNKITWGGHEINKVLHQGKTIWEMIIPVPSTQLYYSDTFLDPYDTPIVRIKTSDYIDTSVSKRIFVRIPNQLRNFVGHANSETNFRCYINSEHVDNNWFRQMPGGSYDGSGWKEEKKNGSYTYLSYRADAPESLVEIQFEMVYYDINDKAVKDMENYTRSNHVTVANSLDLL